MDPSSSSTNNGGIHHPPQEENPLCARGCGFFGTAENRGLCSKCYKEELKEKMAESESAKIGNDHHHHRRHHHHHQQQQEQYKNDSNPLEVEIAKLIDSLKATTIPDTSADKPSASAAAAAPAAKNRCGSCKKKIGLLGFQCRCGGTFCGVHRYPEAHPCQFNFKEAGKIAIAKENPVCKADKISDRI